MFRKRNNSNRSKLIHTTNRTVLVPAFNLAVFENRHWNRNTTAHAFTVASEFVVMLSYTNMHSS